MTSHENVQMKLTEDRPNVILKTSKLKPCEIEYLLGIGAIDLRRVGCCYGCVIRKDDEGRCPKMRAKVVPDDFCSFFSDGWD